MPPTPAFYSINETRKQPSQRVYHNNSACPAGREVQKVELRTGTGSYRLCDDCNRLNYQGR